MKNIIKTMSIALLLSTGAIAHADDTNKGEIGYSEGALGYDAMVAGDYRKATEQIEKSEEVDANDPARLINLGQAYAQLGQYQKAREMLMTAATESKSFDLVLADGEVMNSRRVARIALAKMENQLASR